MRVGADYGNVYCTLSAASAIKSYSPELVVYPELRETRDEEVRTILSSSDSINLLRLMLVPHKIQRVRLLCRTHEANSALFHASASVESIN